MKTWMKRKLIRLLRWLAFKHYYGKPVAFGSDPVLPPAYVGKIVGVAVSETRGIVATITLDGGGYATTPVHLLQKNAWDVRQGFFYHLEGQ